MSGGHYDHHRNDQPDPQVCEQCLTDPFDCPHSGERERTQAMAANLARLAGSPDPNSYHARGRAIDVLPTRDPNVARRMIEWSRRWVAEYMGDDWPWFRRSDGPPHRYDPSVRHRVNEPTVWPYVPPPDARFVCMAGHRFTANPPPGIVTCPECGTEDIALEQEQP